MNLFDTDLWDQLKDLNAREPISFWFAVSGAVLCLRILTLAKYLCGFFAVLLFAYSYFFLLRLCILCSSNANRKIQILYITNGIKCITVKIWFTDDNETIVEERIPFQNYPTQTFPVLCLQLGSTYSNSLSFLLLFSNSFLFLFWCFFVVVIKRFQFVFFIVFFSFSIPLIGENPFSTPKSNLLRFILHSLSLHNIRLYVSQQFV